MAETNAYVVPAALPLLRAGEMRAAEEAWFSAGNHSFALMQKAASAVVAEVERHLPAAGRVLILAGQGNNGGDGYVAGFLLKQKGYRVAIAATGAPQSSDASHAASLWSKIPEATDADWAGADLVVDALFGIGLSRPVDGAALALIRRANQAGIPIVAIDIPSGIDADSGAERGEAIRATLTVTFHTAKPGHFLLPGRLCRGQLKIADIGLPAPVTPLWGNGPGPWAVPVPELGVHKYKRGGVLVWSGPELMTGASRLAASAALRVGAGAVTLVGEAAALRVHASHLTAIMLAAGDPAHFAERARNPKIRACCVGPGAGAPARAAAMAALQSPAAVVLDADALTAFEGDLAHLVRLIGRHRDSGAGPVVLTPHEGEYRRLFGDVPGSRLDRAIHGARETGATLVLKGADGCIAAPDGRAAIACNTQAWLATAGSGDVLAGMITGLMAQGLGGFEAAGCASWLHGELGSRLGLGLTADDLVGPALGALLSTLA